MPAWGCCKPFYDPFYRHEKYDGKLYEVDRGRRRGLHLYLHRIYFTTVDASSKTLAGSSRCTRGGHRSGGSRGGVFYRRPVVPDHGGSCNLRIAALQSESNHRGIKRPTFYPSTTSAAIQWRRGISPRRPYDPRRFLPSATTLGPWGLGLVETRTKSRRKSLTSTTQFCVAQAQNCNATPLRPKFVVLVRGRNCNATPFFALQAESGEVSPTVLQLAWGR